MGNRMIEAAIFDNDGTVADTHDVIMDSFRYTLDKVLGQKAPDEYLMSQVGIPLVDQMALFSDDPQVRQELVRVYRQHNEANHDAGIKEFAGETAALDRIQACGMRMSVATSKMHKLAQHGLEVLGIDSYFELLVGCDDTIAHKPDPEPLLFAASKMGVPIERCAYIGDATFDIRAAKAAGCISVAVTWGMFDEATLAASQPDYMCRTFDELADLMVSMHG